MSDKVTTSTWSVKLFTHFDPEALNSEEVTTEDGKYKYWRPSTPLPFYTFGLFRRKGYICGCLKSFKSKAEYELHFRKAYYEEQTMHEKGLK